MISKPKKLLLFLTIILILSSALTACIQRPKRLSQDQVLDIIWDDFRPNTSSQERSNWDSLEISLVTGREAVNEFSSLSANQCQGPALPENRAIRSTSEYWFVKVAPRADGAESTVIIPSTDQLIVPEPLIQQASFLVDSITGEIIARRLFCQR